MTGITHDEVQPASTSELSRLVSENFADKRQALFPVGGRTALHYGWPTESVGVVVSTANLNRVIDFPARDMTVTVEAGIRMDDLAERIAAERLQLPIDVPQLNRATLGGVVACNVSGPRRFGYGTLRDYVIGLSAVDAGGREFKAGGRVVKNVAGYDLCKLAIGSLGTLAIITQVTLKLKPIPDSQQVLWASFPGFEALDKALERLTGSEARPVIVDVVSPAAADQIASEARVDLPTGHPVLVLLVEGSTRETEWQIGRLKDELAAEWPKSIDQVAGSDTVNLLNALTEFPIGAEQPLTFRASLRPSRTMALLSELDAAGISVAAHAGNGVVIGHLPDETSSAEQARELLSPVLNAVRESRGGFAILNCDDAWKADLPVFGDPPDSWALMRRVKAKLDPHNLLNPGRLFA